MAVDAGVDLRIEVCAEEPSLFSWFSLVPWLQLLLEVAKCLCYYLEFGAAITGQTWPRLFITLVLVLNSPDLELCTLLRRCSSLLLSHHLYGVWPSRLFLFLAHGSFILL